MASDERGIRTVHSIWIDAVNAGDLARLLTLVAEDVVFLSPAQAPCGWEGFSSNFMAAHQQMRIYCTSELEEVVVVGEVAYTWSRDTLSVTSRAAGGKAAQLAGHRMTVYRKQRDGRWLLSRLISGPLHFTPALLNAMSILPNLSTVKFDHLFYVGLLGHIAIRR